MNAPARTRADFIRITRSYRLLREFMRDGQPHTLREMAVAAECSESAVSARWRELKYPCSLDRFAGYEQYKVKIRDTGVWVYWIRLRGVEQIMLAV